MHLLNQLIVLFYEGITPGMFFGVQKWGVRIFALMRYENDRLSMIMMFIVGLGAAVSIVVFVIGSAVDIGRTIAGIVLAAIFLQIPIAMMLEGISGFRKKDKEKPR